jgi:hypothetical protein
MAPSSWLAKAYLGTWQCDAEPDRGIIPSLRRYRSQKCATWWPWLAMVVLVKAVDRILTLSILLEGW